MHIWQEIFDNHNFASKIKLKIIGTHEISFEWSEIETSAKFRSVMAIYRYFSSVDKLTKLPDPSCLLSTTIPSSSIASANAEVRSVLL